MNYDNLIHCDKCKGDACYKQEVTKDTVLLQCFGCGFCSTVLAEKDSEFYSRQMEGLPELYKDLAWVDPKTEQVWLPSTINIPNKGMVFANGTSKDNWRWSAVKAIPVTEEEKHKYPKPGKKGEFYEWRVDMTTLKEFPERDYIEALSYIEVLPE